MRIRTSVALPLFCILCLSFNIDDASARSFIVKVAEGSLHPDRFRPGKGLEGTRPLSSGAGLIRIDGDTDADARQKAASGFKIPTEHIVYIEPDVKRSLLAVPNDSGYPWQAGLKIIGFDESWKQFAEHAEVIVCVIDTGVDTAHPDLKNRIWHNNGEDWQNGAPLADGIDDDADGFVDNHFGVNIIAGKGNPVDDNGHGTSIAGIIAAECNNAIGICGVSSKATILPMKFLDRYGNGSTSDFIAAVDYAIGFKKRTGKPVIINASMGGDEYSQGERDILALAGQEGILVVVPAGNSNEDNDTKPLYPASYDLANIISVASVTNTGQLASFSSWGSTSVDLAAPGEDVYSTKKGGGYGYVTGTSFSTAFVAGVAAVLQSVAPDMGLKARDHIFEGVEKRSGLTDVVASGGTLDMSGAASRAALAQEEWSLPVNKGMNLVSFPLSPLYCGSASLSTGKDNVDSVWRYGEGIWTSYFPAAPGFSDLGCFAAGDGYWIDVKDAGALTIAGFPSTAWPVLKPGWNLVGFPVTEQTAVADLLKQSYDRLSVESVWGYINGHWRTYVVGNDGMSDLTVIEPGRGYWVRVNIGG